MISIEIFPGVWFSKSSTDDLPQDGQRLISRLENEAAFHFIRYMDGFAEKIGQETAEQARVLILESFAHGGKIAAEINRTIEIKRYYQSLTIRNENGETKATIETR